MSELPEDYQVVDATKLVDEAEVAPIRLMQNPERSVIELPAFEDVRENQALYAHASRILTEKPILGMPGLWFKDTAIATSG